MIDGDALDIVSRKAVASAETIVSPLGIGVAAGRDRAVDGHLPLRAAPVSRRLQHAACTLHRRAHDHRHPGHRAERRRDQRLAHGDGGMITVAMVWFFVDRADTRRAGRPYAAAAVAAHR